MRMFWNATQFPGHSTTKSNTGPSYSQLFEKSLFYFLFTKQFSPFLFIILIYKLLKYLYGLSIQWHTIMFKMIIFSFGYIFE